MGLYTYITDQERVSMRKVFDPELNELFQEALQFDPSLLIKNYPVRIRKKLIKGWFSSTIETRYELYHETPASDGTAYQARIQISASKNMDTLVAYLHGIINGASKTIPQC
jgi:hypothetical protein